MSRFLGLTVIVCVSLSSLACDKDKPIDQAPVDEVTPTPTAAPTPTPEAQEAPKPAAQEADAASDAVPAPAKEAGGLFKQAPVEEKVFDAKELPAKLEGELQFGVRWQDFFGENMVAAYKVTQSKGEEVEAKLFVKHWQIEAERGDGSWQLVREYKEFVAPCAFDLTLRAQRGPWTLSDINGDGKAEVTMAWRSGCRSDVSPNTHKVLVIEGDTKYVLRGTSKLSGPEGDGTGTFKADPAFAKAPKGFLEHAELVWAKTVSDNFQ